MSKQTTTYRADQVFLCCVRTSFYLTPNLPAEHVLNAICANQNIEVLLPAQPQGILVR